MGQGIYSFFEALGVGAHLVAGNDRALLIDTGFGFVDLRPSLAKVWKKPLIVMNTHAHSDHCGGNNQFQEVHISTPDRGALDGPFLQQQLDTLISYARKQYPLLNLAMLYFKLQRFKKYDPVIRDLPPSFDLGGRRLRCLPMPGHTPGSTMVLDERSGTVFAGDAVNPGTFLFFDRDLRLPEYARRLEEAAALGGYETLIVSHRIKPLPFSYIAWYADFLRRIRIEKSEKTDIPNEGRTVFTYSEKDTPYGKVSVFFDEDNLG
jgi:glyoxylase-like metal-dependent hydrolase (beta-lactamase superfamily II)